MSKSNELIITSESPEAMVAAFQEVMPHLQKDVRRQLVHLMMSVMMSEGDQGLFRRFNGRSVAEVIAASQEILRVAPIATGEVDGLRYQVFEKPSSEAANGSDPPGNSSSS